MYYADGGLSGIYRIDLTVANPTPQQIVTGNAFTMVADGADLYFSQGADIKKLDLSDNMAMPVTIATVSLVGTLQGMAIKDGYLYFTDRGTTVRRIDLSDPNYAVTNAVTGLSNARGIQFVGEHLYVAEFDSVVIADLSSALPVTSTTTATLVTNLATDLAFDGNDMYVSLYNANKIVKFNVFPVSTDNITKKITWSVYPNPTQDAFRFNGLETTQQYMIFDIMGRVVKEGIVQPDDMISVKSLATGGYFLRLENGEVQQFIKK